MLFGLLYTLKVYFLAFRDRDLYNLYACMHKLKNAYIEGKNLEKLS